MTRERDGVRVKGEVRGFLLTHLARCESLSKIRSG